MADVADTTSLRAYFELRAKRLTREARLFLIAIFAMLIFGAVIVYQAPELTTKDIATDLSGRLATTNAEISKLDARNVEIAEAFVPLRKTCFAPYKEFFDQWAKDNREKADDTRGIWFPDKLPDAAELATKLSELLSSPAITGINIIGLQIIFKECNSSSITLILPKEQYTQIKTALTAGHAFQFDRETFNSLIQEQAKNRQQIDFLTRVAQVLYGREVEVAAGGNTTSQNPDVRSDSLLRLIQTSVTRFGTLTVVVILVGILIPLYRYNVRLAAFYQARADTFLLMAAKVKQAEFDRFSSGLTPKIEFGKGPATPVEQIADFARAVRGVSSDKASE
jgi:hypothetical protein